MLTGTTRTFDINGARLVADIYGEGTPLFFLHGFTGAGVNWSPFLEAFSGHFQLIVPDLRGHGRSTNPPESFTFKQAAGDMLEVARQLGYDRIHAIGASAGAKVLLHMAVQSPDAIQRMVIVSGAPYFPPQARELMRATTIDLLGDEEWAMMREWHVHGDDQIRLLWKQAAGFADSHDDMDLDEGQLRTIQAETLIVHGDRDPFYPLELAILMHESIPKSYLWIAPNGGHTPIFTEPPDRFAFHALPFLRGAWSE